MTFDVKVGVLEAELQVLPFSCGKSLMDALSSHNFFIEGDESLLETLNMQTYCRSKQRELCWVPQQQANPEV